MKEPLLEKAKLPGEKKPLFSFSEKTLKKLRQTKNVTLSISALFSTLAGVLALFFPPAAIALAGLAILASAIGFASSFLESKSFKKSETSKAETEKQKLEKGKTKEKEKEKDLKPSFKDKLATKIASSKIFKKMFKKPIDPKKIKTVENVSYGIGIALTLAVAIAGIFFPPALLGLGVACAGAYAVSSLASIASAIAEKHASNIKLPDISEELDRKPASKMEKTIDDLTNKKDQFLAKLYSPAIFEKIPKKLQDPKELQRISDMSGFVGAGFATAATVIAFVFPPLMIPLLVLTGLSYGVSFLSLGASKIIEAHNRQEELKSSNLPDKIKTLEKNDISLIKTEEKTISKADSKKLVEKSEKKLRIPAPDSTPQNGKYHKLTGSDHSMN